MECPNRDRFCMLCGLYTPKSHMRPITPSFVKGYEEYFKLKYSPNLYVPQIVCDYCYRAILATTSDTEQKHPMRFVSPVVWLPRSEHNKSLCYFCLTNTFGYQYSTRKTILYANVPSVLPAKLFSDAHPDQEADKEHEVDFIEPFAEEEPIEMEGLFERPEPGVRKRDLRIESTATTSSEFIPSEADLDVPQLMTQAEFNDLVRETKISFRAAELWGSRLQEKKLVAPGFKVTYARKRSNVKTLDECFAFHENSKISYCNNIDALFDRFGHPHHPEEWRLFIDSSVESLKVVLLHIGNQYPSVPIGYGREVSEDYDTMKLILSLINYELYQWKICCDLKVVALLTGLKKGFSKHQCFLCNWEGRAKDRHYTEEKWAPRIVYQIGTDSIDHMPLVQPSKVILPPLHIKLGLIRNFIRALDQTGGAFQYLHTVFPDVSAAKIQAGTFVFLDKVIF